MEQLLNSCRKAHDFKHEVCFPAHAVVRGMVVCEVNVRHSRWKRKSNHVIDYDCVAGASRCSGMKDMLN